MHLHEKNIAVVMLHGSCDMFCKFCITDNAVECMTPDDFAETLTVLEKAGFTNIVIGGGEPFTWPYGLQNAAKIAKSEGFLVQVGTNGIKMPDGAAYPDCVDRYVLPLDGTTRTEHNRVRHFPHQIGGHFQIIMNRLAQLKEAERSVTVSTVVTRHTVANLHTLGAFLADYVQTGGILHAWHLYRFLPAGRGGAKSAEELSISSAEFEDATTAVKDQNYPFTIFKRRDMRHSAHVDFFWRQKGTVLRGSDYWKQTAALSPIGAF
mgnify:FL=1|jgi:MoaA/NifB/PqqE/SkfB family radical SAM enzyme